MPALSLVRHLSPCPRGANAFLLRRRHGGREEGVGAALELASSPMPFICFAPSIFCVMLPLPLWRERIHRASVLCMAGLRCLLSSISFCSCCAYQTIINSEEGDTLAARLLGDACIAIHKYGSMACILECAHRGGSLRLARRAHFDARAPLSRALSVPRRHTDNLLSNAALTSQHTTRRSAYPSFPS